MARAQENPVANPPYLEFFGLTRPPFARLADPSQTFHTEQYSLLMDHLASATQEPDSLVVICGADGSGKSTLLNRYITSLGNHISFVAIDETCVNEEEFYSACLTQIGFTDITGAASELKNITKEFLIHRGMAGDSVLIIIDNAHLIVPAILDQIRWISDIKIKGRRVVSVVLAGNADLVHVVDAPAMNKTKFRSHVLFNIRNYTEEETTSYVWHRLRLAGGNDGVKIPHEAHPLIHRYSGGIPNLINKLCNDMLTEAHTLESRVITEALVRTVADNQHLMPHVIPLHGKGRRRTDPDYNPAQQERRSEERIIARDSTPSDSIPQAQAAAPDGDTINRQEHLAVLTAQVEDLRADKMRALSDISARDKDIRTRDKEISELQDKLSSQTAELETLTGTIDASAAESEQRNRALSNSTTAFRESEEASRKLTEELTEEKRAHASVQAKLVSATATVEELSKLKEELQTAVSGLQGKLSSEIGVKGGELESLRGELETQNQALADNTRELEQQYQALSDSATALQESEKLAMNLRADLEKETRFRESAEGDLVAAKTTVEELGNLKQELLTTVDGLKGDLGAADERAGEIESLKENAAELKNETDKKADELSSLQDKLESKDEAINDLEKQLDESRQELESEQSRAASLKDPRALRKSEKTTKKLTTRLEKETEAREAAQNDLAAAKESVEELNQQNLELQTAISDLQADLKVAGERVVEFEVLEQNTADLREEIGKNGGELESLREKLQSRDQAIADLEKNTTELKNDAEKKTGELESLRAELDSRSQSIIDLEQNTTKLNDDAEKKTGELESLRVELDSSNQAVADLEKNTADLKDEVQEKTDKLESLNVELDSRNQAVADLEKNTAELRSETQEKADKLESLHVELASRDQAVVDLETNVVDLKDLVGRKADEMESLRDDLGSRNDALAELKTLLDESQKEYELAQLRIAELIEPKELQKSEDAKGKLADQLEEEKQAREKAENDLATATATIEELSQLKLELQAAISDLEIDLKVAGERVDEIDALEQNTADLKDGIEEKGGQLQSLRDELKSRSRSLAELEKATSDLKIEVGEKNDELESLRSELSARDQSLAVFEKNAADLEDDVGKKAGDLESLQDELQSQQQAAADLEKNSADLNAEIWRKDSELESLRGELNARDQSLADFEKNAADLEDDVGKKAGDLESLRGELESRHQAVADLETKTADLDAEIGKKDDELESLRDELNSRERSLADIEKNASNLEDDVGRKAGDLESLRNELESRHRAVADLEKKSTDLDAEIGKKDDELESLRDELNSRDRSLAEVEKNAADLENDVGKKTDDVEAIKDELNSKQQAVADLEKKTAVLNAEIEKNSYELESLRDELNSRDQSLADFEKNAAHLEDDVGKKAGDLESLRYDLESRDHSIAELEKSTADLKIEVGEKAGELETLKNELAIRDRSLTDIEKYAANLNDDVRGRDGKLESLQDEVDSRNQAFADLQLQLDQSRKECETAQRRVAELKNPKALRKSEKLSKKLTNKLEKETRARELAQKDLASVKLTVKGLKQLKKELQTENRDLNSDLTVAGERVVQTGIVEKNAAALKEEVTKVTSELKSRDTAFAEIQEQLEASHRESEALRLRVVAMENAMASGSVAAATDQVAGVDSAQAGKSSRKSIQDEPAYKALREFDETIYNRLISKHKKLNKKGRKEKQISDVLRTEQAELIEKLLTRASDEAVISYARLIIAQLNDFQLDGSEPSFKLLRPRTDDDIDGLPVYSERTRERELAVLEMTLKTYDAKRAIPQEEEVWPDLEPIFMKLFDAYGEDNVSALQNSYAPDIGKDVVCKISRSLYSRILKLPEAHAAKALRWILSP